MHSVFPQIGKAIPPSPTKDRKRDTGSPLRNNGSPMRRNSRSDRRYDAADSALSPHAHDLP